jgi:hypothetical protein
VLPEIVLPEIVLPEIVLPAFLRRRRSIPRPAMAHQ